MVKLRSSGEDWVWYAAYGSNLHAARLAVYLSGGIPEGGRRATSGCRDPRPPRASRAVEVPGGIFFATTSLVWGGGRAFYDPGLPGTAAMRAYLITVSQFSDIAAQEMYGVVGEDLDLTEVLEAGRASLGPGRYQTLLRLPGEPVPVLTFTCPRRAGGQPGVPPSAGYLVNLARGLRESHGWPVSRIADYLAQAPGAAGHWDPSAIAALLS